MGFLDVGTGEILLVLVIALVVLGPKRVVEVGRTLGKIVRTMKKTTSDLTAAVTREIDGKGKDSPH